VTQRSLTDIAKEPQTVEEARWAMNQSTFDSLNDAAKNRIANFLMENDTEETALESLQSIPNDFKEIAERFEVKTFSQISGLPSYQDDKALLVGKEFVIVGWKFMNSVKVKGRQLVKVLALMRETDSDGKPKKVQFTDFSTGIFNQLKSVGVWEPRMAIHCPKGLRVSKDYPVQLPDGTEIRGTTYYLNES